MKDLISVNIINFNNKDTIIPAIKSAISQTYKNIEILIMDNNSEDGSLEMIKKFIKANHSVPIKLMENKENLGFAKAHNLGIKICNGEFILCLNSDAILSPNYIENAIKLFSSPKVGAVQGKLLKYDFFENKPKKINNYNIIDTTGLVMLKNRRIINRGQGEPDKNQYQKIEEIFGPDGAAPIYRKSTLDDVAINGEYFDEDFFCYKEDVDLAWRMRLFGWKTIYCPSCIAFHSRGAGESAKMSYINIIKERRKIKSLPKYWSFKNQRLMQIKNEIPLLFLRHFPYWAIKEIGSWLYILFFETYTLKAIKELIAQFPNTLKKRQIIMKNKRVNWTEMEKWFK